MKRESLVPKVSFECRILFILVVCSSLFLLSCSSTTNIGGEEYKKVIISGSVKITPDSEFLALTLDENEGYLTCLGSAEFEMELYFPIDGGDSLSGSGVYFLTDYSCYEYGIADPCEGVLPEESIEEQSFEVYGELIVDLGGFTDTGDALQTVDQVYFGVKELPLGEMATVEMFCEGQEPYLIPDPGLFSQVLMPFYFMYNSVNVQENVISSVSEHSFLLENNLYATLEYENTMEIVSEIE